MKKTMLQAIVFCLFTCLVFSGKAQIATTTATIFEMKMENINEVGEEIITMMLDSGIYIAPTFPDALVDFLNTPFYNQFYSYSPSTCPSPGLEVTSDMTQLAFQFNNLTSTTGNLLFMGALDYGIGSSLGNTENTSAYFSVYGPEVYNGVEYDQSDIEYRIIMVGTYCSPIAGAANQQYSNIEIVIVDKNIL